MKNINKNNDRSRRDFLKLGSSLAVSAFILPVFDSALIGSTKTLLFDKEIPSIELNNGVKMPRLGFGTNTLNGDVGVRSVSDAISVGYRLIDTAHIYANEEAVGKGIKKSAIAREKLFITSKLWVDDSGYESTKKAFETSIKKLGVDYLDLYLIHRPRGDVKGSWKAMEDLYDEGKIKAIGISNFEIDQLEELKKYAKVTPAVNQIETHAFFNQKEAYKIMHKSDTQIEAWSPLAEGRNNIFQNPTLAAIAKKHNKSIAQVCLRWHFQRDVIAIPRSSNKNHMIENLNIFDFELDKDDFKTIVSLDLNKTQFPEWS